MMLNQKSIAGDETQIMPRALDVTRPMPAAGFLRRETPAEESRLSKKLAAVFVCAFFAAASAGFYSAQYAREKIELAENAWAHNRRTELAFGGDYAAPLEMMRKAFAEAERSEYELESAVKSLKYRQERARAFATEQFDRLESARRFLQEKKTALLAFFQRKESARQ